MLRKVLLFAVVSVSLVAFGQTGAVGPAEAQPTNPAQIGSPAYPTQVPLGNGLGWSGGTVGYYGEGPAGGVLLSTPTASFDSPLPTAGISLAGRAGISDLSPINSAVQSTATNSTLVYSNVPGEVPATASPATAAVSSGSTTRDFGPSYFSNEIGGSYTRMSLAQIADQYRAQAPGGLRTYTNADVHPARTAADEENRLLAGNRPPALPQGNTTTPSAPNSQANTSTQTAAIQSSAQQTQAQGSTTTELPASGSPLPLLGLMGMICVGLGLLVRGTKNRGIGSSGHRVIGNAR